MPAVTAPLEGSAAEPVRPVGDRTLVITGTDHHPFDRLISWTNDWLVQHPEQADRFFVQWGSTSARPTCPGTPFLEIGELEDLLDQASVIVCHGGPTTIAEAWARGQLPIVVPRLARLGEHVDDHQADFCERFSALGRIALARTLPEFTRLLGEAEAEPACFRIKISSSPADQAVACLGGLIEELVSRPRRQSPIGNSRWFRYRRRTGRLRRYPTGSSSGSTTAGQAELHNSGAAPQLRIMEQYKYENKNPLRCLGRGGERRDYGRFAGGCGAHRQLGASGKSGCRRLSDSSNPVASRTV
jgi:UDP-N-acetylglucosamine transferase subunit ALG13